MVNNDFQITSLCKPRIDSYYVASSVYSSDIS